MDGQNGRRDASVVQHTVVRISWPIYQCGIADAYWRTQINVRAVYISNSRHQYSPIDLLIYQLIGISTDGQNGRRYTSVGQNTAVRIPRTDLSTDIRRRLSTDTNWRTGPQLTDLSTDGRNGWMYTAVGQKIAVRISWLIYQRRRGGRIYLSIQQRSDSCVPLCHISSTWFLLLI